MNRYDIARVVGDLIVVLIGFAIAVGSFQLRSGKPLSWPDIVAEDSTVRIAAGAMAAVAAVLVVAGAAAILALGWGYAAAMIATCVFVVGGFWANYVLFADIRPLHTVPNVIVAALVIWLLWLGYSRSVGGTPM